MPAIQEFENRGPKFFAAIGFGVGLIFVYLFSTHSEEEGFYNLRGVPVFLIPFICAGALYLVALAIQKLGRWMDRDIRPRPTYGKSLSADDWTGETRKFVEKVVAYSENPAIRGHRMFAFSWWKRLLAFFAGAVAGVVLVLALVAFLIPSLGEVFTRWGEDFQLYACLGAVSVFPLLMFLDYRSNRCFFCGGKLERRKVDAGTEPWSEYAVCHQCRLYEHRFEESGGG